MQKNRVNQLIIIEGSDRIGKTTSILSLVDALKTSGYEVVTFGVKTSEAQNAIDSSAFTKLTKDNIELLDIAAIRVMQFAWDCKKIFEVSANQKGCIIVVDRLHLSNYIYGYLLRRERFESIWGVSGALLLEVNKAFEETAQSFCDVKLLTFVKSNDSEDYADDNLHEIVSVTVGQQVLANEYFEWLHDESSIVDKRLTILAVKDSNGLYPTLDFMLRSVKSLLQK